MTVAVSKAVEEGAEAVICASTGNTAASRRRLRRARRASRPSCSLPRGRRRRGEGGADAHARRARCSRCAATSTRRSRPPGSSRAAAPTCSSTRSTRTGARARRRRCSRSSRSSAASPDAFVPPVRRRRQHVGLRARRSRELGDQPTRRSSPSRRATGATTLATAIRIGEPVHAATAAAAIRRTEGALVTLDDDEIVAAWRELARDGGPLLRAVVRGRARGAPARRPSRASGVVVTSPVTGSRTRRAPTAYAPPPVRGRRRSRRDRRRRAPMIVRHAPRPRPTSAPASTPPRSRSTSGTSSR